MGDYRKEALASIRKAFKFPEEKKTPLQERIESEEEKGNMEMVERLKKEQERRKLAGIE